MRHWTITTRYAVIVLQVFYFVVFYIIIVILKYCNYKDCNTALRANDFSVPTISWTQTSSYVVDFFKSKKIDTIINNSLSRFKAQNLLSQFNIFLSKLSAAYGHGGMSFYKWNMIIG